MSAPTLAIHPGNAAQLAAWDGDEGRYWAAHAAEFDRSVARYDEALFTAAAIGERDRVLDIGCGTGSTTCAAGRTAASAVGVDLSAPMLAVARRAADDQALANVSFVQADAQIHAFPAGSFDVAISRSGAMFFADPVAAFTTIGRALRPGGRLVLVVWQEIARNEWFRELTGALAADRPPPSPPPGAPSPFALADPDRVRAVLTAAGFDGIDVVGVEEPVYFGADAPAAAEFVLGLLGWMLAGLDDEARGRALAALHGTLAAHDGPDGVAFGSAGWLVTARRAG